MNSAHQRTTENRDLDRSLEIAVDLSEKALMSYFREIKKEYEAVLEKESPEREAAMATFFKKYPSLDREEYRPENLKGKELVVFKDYNRWALANMAYDLFNTSIAVEDMVRESSVRRKRARESSEGGDVKKSRVCKK